MALAARWRVIVELANGADLMTAESDLFDKYSLFAGDVSQLASSESVGRGPEGTNSSFQLLTSNQFKRSPKSVTSVQSAPKSHTGLTSK
jgi:hypothetical protein